MTDIRMHPLLAPATQRHDRGGPAAHRHRRYPGTRRRPNSRSASTKMPPELFLAALSPPTPHRRSQGKKGPDDITDNSDGSPEGRQGANAHTPTHRRAPRVH